MGQLADMSRKTGTTGTTKTCMDDRPNSIITCVQAVQQKTYRQPPAIFSHSELRQLWDKFRTVQGQLKDN